MDKTPTLTGSIFLFITANRVKEFAICSFRTHLSHITSFLSSLLFLKIQLKAHPFYPNLAWKTSSRVFVFVFTFLFVMILAALKTWMKSKTNGYGPASRLPPGPPKIPFLGNLHLFVGTHQPHCCLTSLARKFGPVMHLQLGNYRPLSSLQQKQLNK